MNSGFDRILAGVEFYRAKYAEELRVRPPHTETFVISFPKSGRTWHRALVGTYFSLAHGANMRDIFSLGSLTQAAGIGSIHYTHNGANFLDGLEPSDPLVANPELWRGKKVIWLTRDVRDVLVSAWHHARFREGLTDADLSSFVRHPVTGIEKLLGAIQRWQAESRQAAASLRLSYERMHQDPENALRETLLFLGLSSVDNERVTRAVQECSFEAMRQRETSGFYSSPIASTTSGDARARKARMGRVGGFIEHLDASDLAFIDNALAKAGVSPTSQICLP